MEVLRSIAANYSRINCYGQLVARYERLGASQREALRQAEYLFQCLLHQAFTANS